MSKTTGSFPSKFPLAFSAFSTMTASAVITALLLVSTGTALAADYLVPDGVAHRAGLKVEWNSQMQVGGASKMVDWFLQINENLSTTYFTMESGPLREVVSNRQLNFKGEPYGMDGAKEEIDFRAELLEARYKKRGVEGYEIKRSSYSLPKSVLYTLASNGMVSAIDADTGVHHWDRVINSNSRVIGLGASDSKVAVVIGSRVYCLNATDGRVLWDRQTKYSPGSSPAVSDTHIVVPLANGRLQSYSIEEEGLGSNSYFASGFSSARPLVTPSGVAWVTDNGHLNFANPKTSSAVNFRLKASDAIISSPTGKGDMIFFASLDGYVYGVDRVKGRVDWEVTTGSGISTSPVPIGDALFVVSDRKQLYKLDSRTGLYASGWETPMEGVDKFLGATRKSVFGLDSFNRLVVIDQASGRQTSSIPVGDIALVLTNYESDRIYVASAQGLVQCVRDISSPRPIFHSSEFDTSVMVDGKKKPMSKSKEEDPFGDEEDPFDDGGDPFGDDEMSSEEDSGADDENPFGADDEDDDDGNPFN